MHMGASKDKLLGRSTDTLRRNSVMIDIDMEEELETVARARLVIWEVEKEGDAEEGAQEQVATEEVGKGREAEEGWDWLEEEKVEEVKEEEEEMEGDIHPIPKE
mmetsp:Transcript_5475/g.7401  ORF Transcript_5475/g.7401 Transcript_5475/m.7401 type:complete len:104 (+) Transcript_5475:298-609(+)